ncbi:MAG TPA: hypothetical protein DCX34_17710, partial [Roseovarius sp.]|nr:hypothetical protein [Roseovarius sp.]
MEWSGRSPLGINARSNGAPWRAAAHRRAAPTARRFGRNLRAARAFFGFGCHKARQKQRWIAAPR